MEVHEVLYDALIFLVIMTSFIGIVALVTPMVLGLIKLVQVLGRRWGV